MTISVQALSPSEIQSAILQSDQIASAATPTVTSNQFVFFAAFHWMIKTADAQAARGDALVRHALAPRWEVWTAKAGGVLYMPVKPAANDGVWTAAA